MKGKDRTTPFRRGGEPEFDIQCHISSSDPRLKIIFHSPGEGLKLRGVCILRTLLLKTAGGEILPSKLQHKSKLRYPSVEAKLFCFKKNQVVERISTLEEHIYGDDKMGFG